MDIFIQDHRNLLPPEEVRITRVTATPYDDRRRVRVTVEMTPFAVQPNLDITLYHAEKPIASTSVVAVMNFRVAFTLHLRGAPPPEGECRASVQLYYDDDEHPQDVQSADFTLPPQAPSQAS